MLNRFLAAHSVGNDFFEWIQFHFGEHTTHYGRSFSAALHEALNAWGLLEGTHLLTMMLFFGTIVLVDTRLLGWTFRKTPVSVFSERLLPLTVVAMVIAMITGPMLFFAKPQDYYHNFWFRLKMIVLVVAILNVYIFHKVVQKDQASWDTQETPPAKARLSGAVSLISWLVVMSCGRLIAYNFLECGKPHSAFINFTEECATSPLGAVTQADYDKQLADQKKAAEAAPVAAATPVTPAPTADAPKGKTAAPAGAAKPEAK